MTKMTVPASGSLLARRGIRCADSQGNIGRDKPPRAWLTTAVGRQGLRAALQLGELENTSWGTDAGGDASGGVTCLPHYSVSQSGHRLGHFGTDNSLWRGLSVHFRVFSRIPGLYPLDAHSTLPPGL